jgi:hypothetical protein
VGDEALNIEYIHEAPFNLIHHCTAAQKHLETQKNLSAAETITAAAAQPSTDNFVGENGSSSCHDNSVCTQEPPGIK